MGRFWIAQELPIHVKKRLPSWLTFTRNLNYEPREYPQNADLPPLVQPRKKPFARPLELVIWEYKRDKKLGVRKLWKAPNNGMLIEHLVPMAHEILKEYAVLEEGVRRLMQSIPVKACTCCMEVHIARVGHRLPTCRGTANHEVYRQHRWIRGYVEDVLVPIEAYHVHDKLGPSIKHNQRYTVPRVSAIHELCMHAGVDDPRYPMIRWARRSGRQVGDGHAQVPLTKFRNVIVPGYSDDESSSETDDEDDEEVGDDGKEADGKMMAKRAEEAGLKTENEPVDAESPGELRSKSSEELQVEETIEKHLQNVDEKEQLELMRLDEAEAGDTQEDSFQEKDFTASPKVIDEDEDLLYQKLKKLSGVEQPMDTEVLSDTKLRRWAEVCGTWTIADPTDAEKEELKLVAERTLKAFDTVRKSIQVLLYKYRVWTCGYCSEVHVGVKPHKVKLCGGFGRGFRDGLHTWQEAALSDVFPPNFVWHVPAGHNPRLSPEFIRFYGQAPAVVELCVQAGAEPPERWRPFMRMDVVVPEEQEALWAA